MLNACVTPAWPRCMKPSHQINIAAFYWFEDVEHNVDITTTSMLIIAEDLIENKEVMLCQGLINNFNCIQFWVIAWPVNHSEYQPNLDIAGMIQLPEWFHHIQHIAHCIKLSNICSGLCNATYTCKICGSHAAGTFVSLPRILAQSSAKHAGNAHNLKIKPLFGQALVQAIHSGLCRIWPRIHAGLVFPFNRWGICFKAYYRAYARVIHALGRMSSLCDQS